MAVNISVALMLGVLYLGTGNEGSRVLDNYKLLFAILMHCSMATMMLTVLTCMYWWGAFWFVLCSFCSGIWWQWVPERKAESGKNLVEPMFINNSNIRIFYFYFPINYLVPTEMGILLKEHFNRWYSLKSYYISVTLLDLPISVMKMKNYLAIKLVFYVGQMYCN